LSSPICPSKNVWTEIQIMKILIMQCYSYSCHFLSLRSKYFCQNSVLKYSQSVYFSWCERSKFTTRKLSTMKMYLVLN
jgi:hypothetical protein